MKRIVVHCIDGSEPFIMDLSSADVDHLVQSIHKAHPDGLIAFVADNSTFYVARRHIAWVAETEL